MVYCCCFRPDLVDFTHAMSHDDSKGLSNALNIAEKKLGVPRIIEPKGMAFNTSLWTAARINN